MNVSQLQSFRDQDTSDFRQYRFDIRQCTFETGRYALYFRYLTVCIEQWTSGIIPYALNVCVRLELRQCTFDIGCYILDFINNMLCIGHWMLEIRLSIYIYVYIYKYIYMYTYILICIYIRK